jgi:hypothetical protein
MEHLSTARRGYVSPRIPEKVRSAIRPNVPGTWGDFTYHSGPVIHEPKLSILFVGNWSSRASQGRMTRLTQFVGDFLGSRYMNILSQYGCGRHGAIVASSVVSAPNASLSAQDIYKIIQDAITNHLIPEANGRWFCVLLYLDDSTAVNDADTGNVMCEPTSDTAFGYHHHFLTAAGNRYPFAVVPGLTDSCLKSSCASDAKCSLHLSATQEQRQTKVTSHELSEMFSNPLVEFREAWSRPGTSDPHENGDICNEQSATITVGTNTWTVQKMYSKYHDATTNGATTCISESDPLPNLLPGLGNRNFIETDWGSPGNFELLVPHGHVIREYFRDNDAQGVPWHFSREFGYPPQAGTQSPSPRSITFIQSNFSSDGSHGNFEAIVRVAPANPNNPDYLDFWWFESGTTQWHGPFPLTADGQPVTGVTGDPVFIQTDWGSQGNFELLVPHGHVIREYFRDNDAPGVPWHFSREFGYPPQAGAQGPSPRSIIFIQSNFSGDGSHGNFEAIVRVAPANASDPDYLDFWWFESGTTQWHGPAPLIADGQPVNGVTGN